MSGAHRIVIGPQRIDREVIAATTIEHNGEVGNITGFSLVWAPPAPTTDLRPHLATGRAHWIPNGRVVAEVIGEVGAATGFVEDGDGEVGVQVGEVDDVGAAAEGAEGR